MRGRIIDQSLHFAAALLIGLIFMAGGVIAGAIAGAGCGLVREVSESGTPVRWAAVKAQLTQTDAAIDVSFWAVGGSAAALIAGWMQ